MERWLYVPLSLLEHEADRESKFVGMLSRIGGYFTHIMLVARSFQETPHAIHHSLVNKAVEHVARAGRSLVWCRWALIGWPDGYPTDRFDLLEGDYWEETIRRVRLEAQCLGAQSGLDCEAYGKGSDHRWWKDQGMRSGEVDALRAAVETGVRWAENEPVDVTTPCASTSPEWFGWATSYVAHKGINNKSHYVPADGGLPPMRVPTGYRCRMDYWAQYVTLGVDKDAPRRLSVDRVKNLNWDLVVARNPETRGIMVYAHESELVNVAEAFG